MADSRDLNRSVAYRLAAVDPSANRIPAWSPVLRGRSVLREPETLGWDYPAGGFAFSARPGSPLLDIVLVHEGGKTERRAPIREHRWPSRLGAENPPGRTRAPAADYTPGLTHDAVLVPRWRIRPLVPDLVGRQHRMTGDMTEHQSEAVQRPADDGRALFDAIARQHNLDGTEKIWAWAGWQMRNLSLKDTQRSSPDEQAK